MKRSFAIGFGAGVLAVLAGMLVHAARREPTRIAEPAAREPAAHQPADPAPGELAAARARIGALEAEIARAKQQAAAKGASMSRMEAIVKRLGGELPDPSDDNAASKRLWIELQVLIADLAGAQGLELDEASVEPGAWLAFLAAVLNAKTPPLTAGQQAQIEDLKKRYAAEWSAYREKRDSLLGVERQLALQRLFATSYETAKDILANEDDETLDNAWGSWPNSSLQSGTGLTPYREMPDDELIASIGEDWGRKLGLREDQQEALPALVVEYVRTVRAAHVAGTSGYPTNLDIEDKAMIDIQRRMAAALRLDAGQLARLRKWAEVPGIDGRK